VHRFSGESARTRSSRECFNSHARVSTCAHEQFAPLVGFLHRTLFQLQGISSDYQHCRHTVHLEGGMKGRTVNRALGRSLLRRRPPGAFFDMVETETRGKVLLEKARPLREALAVGRQDLQEPLGEPWRLVPVDMLPVGHLEIA
jgi:hypothetical protein